LSSLNQSLEPKGIIFLEYKSLEELNRSKTEALGWGKYTDVLYSFLGIFAVGVYIFEEDKDSKFSIGKDNIIRIAGTKKWLYSRKYIKENFSEFSELANVKELKDFAKVYDLIGNIFPIWPGGNEFKGKSGCYDIPDIFFYNHGEMEKVYIQYFLKKKVKDVALTRFVADSPLYVNSIETVFKYNKKEYTEFVKHIVEEIEMRTEEINKIINTNSNL